MRWMRLLKVVSVVAAAVAGAFLGFLATAEAYLAWWIDDNWTCDCPPGVLCSARHPKHQIRF